MSAIAGAVHVDGRAMSDAVLADMIQASAQRGFDPVSRWRSDRAGLIRFAHATTPEATGETQPFIDGGSGAAMLFDGRIDNRAELIALLDRDERLRRAPDGQIALALYGRYGDDFVERIVGDFAIALWQPRDRRLLLLRSAGGWRPLLWTFDHRTFAFATEPKALLVGLGLERRLNEGAIGEYLAARFTSRTETFWRGISQLPPGCALALDGDRVREWRWHGGPFEDLSGLSAEEHVERFLTVFDEALISVSRSQTPVTAQLSGGLDSSSVVCRMTELHRGGRIAEQVRAISARFPGQVQDETEWSSAVERHLGIPAEVVGERPFDIEQAARWCAESYQLPLRPNVLDTLANSCVRLRADGRRVLLTGEGGDDWLDGMREHWPDLLLRGRWGALLRDARVRPGSTHRAVLAAGYHSVMPILSHRHRMRLFHPEFSAARGGVPDWIRPDWAKRIGLIDRWHAPEMPDGLRGFAQKSRYGAFHPARRHVNMDAPIAYAESHGIEIRHPLHDQRLSRFAMGADGTVLRALGQKRYVLREAMRGTLPEVVRTRTTKASFVGHVVDAAEEYFRRRPPETMACVRLGWVDGKRLAELHEPYRQWRAAGSVAKAPYGHGNAVWFAVATDLWLENAFGL
jgi:asparagine synthase (glutamine-hydrolysing)